MSSGSPERREIAARRSAVTVQDLLYVAFLLVIMGLVSGSFGAQWGISFSLMLIVCAGVFLLLMRMRHRHRGRSRMRAYQSE